MLHYVVWFIKKRLRREKSFIVFAILLLILLAISFLFTPENLETTGDTPVGIINSCHVMHIGDGDSINVDCGPQKNEIRIRIWGIDAPELGQKPWGNQAKKYLEDLIGSNRVVKVEIIEIDRYDRKVARIYKNEIDLGLEMVKSGQAIVYHRYNNDNNYKRLEMEAKKDRIGVWSTSGAQQTPEKWRRLNKR